MAESQTVIKKTSLGMCEIYERVPLSEIGPPLAKRPCSSAAPEELLPPISSTHNEPLPQEVNRFDFSTEEELAELAEGLVPKSTAKNTQWAIANFSEWRIQRNLK